jgi:hypothetical protein
MTSINIYNHVVPTTYARGFNDALPNAVVTTQAAGAAGNVIVRLWDHFTCSGVIKAEVRFSITQTEALIESLTYAVEQAKQLLDEEIAAIAITNSIPE